MKGLLFFVVAISSVAIAKANSTEYRSRTSSLASTTQATCEFDAPAAHRLRFAGLCDGRTYEKVTIAVHDGRTLVAQLYQIRSEAQSWNDSRKLIVISQLKSWANSTVNDLRLNATFDVYNPDGKVVAECTRPANSKKVTCS